MFEKDISFIATNILLASLICLHGVVQPFKNKFHNIQEPIAIVNLLAAHVTLLYKNDLLGLKVAQILLACGAAYFIIAIIFHCCMYRWGDSIFKVIKWLHRKICEKKILEKNNSIEMKGLSSRITDVTYNYQEFQEPLVEFET